MLRNKKSDKLYLINYPWKRTWTQIKQRCNNPKDISYNNYGGRGIKCLITIEEVKQLWFRNKAYNLKRPSIDRINNNGDYTLENCRFIELSENIAKDKRKSILQFDLRGNFIKVWSSAREVEQNLGIWNTNILSCIRGKRKTCGGFKWELQKETYDK